MVRILLSVGLLLSNVAVAADANVPETIIVRVRKGMYQDVALFLSNQALVAPQQIESRNFVSVAPGHEKEAATYKYGFSPKFVVSAYWAKPDPGRAFGCGYPYVDAGGKDVFVYLEKYDSYETSGFIYNYCRRSGSSHY
jgi:hypothetical protein